MPLTASMPRRTCPSSYHRGSNEPPETFFQHREASNTAYNHLVDVVVENMNKVNAAIGTNYKPFNYYGAPDATDVIVAMGSVCGTLEEVVDVMTAQGKKVGVLEVHLFRPFSAKHMLSELAGDRSASGGSGPHQGTRCLWRAPVPGMWRRCSATPAARTSG